MMLQTVQSVPSLGLLYVYVRVNIVFYDIDLHLWPLTLTVTRSRSLLSRRKSCHVSWKKWKEAEEWRILFQKIDISRNISGKIQNLVQIRIRTGPWSISSY